MIPHAIALNPAHAWLSAVRPFRVGPETRALLACRAGLAVGLGERGKVPAPTRVRFLAHCPGTAQPVYDEQGALLADSVKGAAAHFGCRPATMYHHMRRWEDGHRLVSRPDPANVGRTGGARRKREAS